MYISPAAGPTGSPQIHLSSSGQKKRVFLHLLVQSHSRCLSPTLPAGFEGVTYLPSYIIVPLSACIHHTSSLSAGTPRTAHTKVARLHSGHPEHRLTKISRLPCAMPNLGIAASNKVSTISNPDLDCFISRGGS